ncbi:hypothetical protein B0O99DRAFT_668534 [Bisporella sp. PMI_857]|nr:hypothetical protein B0O99DRAFT_668534 [Bisporella sp. PMI_857]
MMNANFGTPTWEANHLGYSTVESLLDEAAFNLKRYSRCSGGQRTERPGGSMRISKPNSTSNSPRASMGLGRRKTVMSDRRRITSDQVLDALVSNDGIHHPAKSSRPVSWHPSTHFQPQQQYYQPNPISNLNDFQMLDFPPTPIIYSGYGSPSSTFSPLSMPFTGYEQQPQFATAFSTTDCNNMAPQMMETQHIPQYLATPIENNGSFMLSHHDWANFVANDCQSSTAPPTPENFLPIQHPDPTFPEEEAIPYHPLSEATEEEEGEVLRGLGLYDAPDVLKSVPSDPHLNNYRSSVMSQLMGSAYRIESSGKGLKLEETWNPPASDDEEEEEEEEDDQEDGEGEDEDDTAFQTTQNNSTATTQSIDTVPRIPHRGQSFNNSKWV